MGYEQTSLCNVFVALWQPSSNIASLPSPPSLHCRLSELTYSLWGYMWGHLDEYLNPLYQSDAHEGVLIPSTSIPHLRWAVMLQEVELFLILLSPLPQLLARTLLQPRW